MTFQTSEFWRVIMVGIIFLELLPQIVTGQEHLDKYIYLPFLFGFTVIALIEKIIYKRIQGKELKQKARNTLELNDKATYTIFAFSLELILYIVVRYMIPLGKKASRHFLFLAFY
ncbi:MAG: hypothetical protein DRP23_05240 [Thermotogae bacterium]|nr:MAG: hypothetical protein DRP23_05240 [Thermotogota bacterium]